MERLPALFYFKIMKNLENLFNILVKKVNKLNRSKKSVFVVKMGDANNNPIIKKYLIDEIGGLSVNRMEVGLTHIYSDKKFTDGKTTIKIFLHQDKSYTQIDVFTAGISSESTLTISTALFKTGSEPSSLLGLEYVDSRNLEFLIEIEVFK